MELGYFLHARAFQESSVLLDCFTRDSGIVSCIAKGAKRPKSAWRGLVQPFILVNIDYRGRGEVKTIVQLEAEKILPCLSGKKVLIGMYLNEILLKLVQRNDPNPELFHSYHETLGFIARADADIDMQYQLRLFECQLLRSLGFGIDFLHDMHGHAIVEDVVYGYDPERGFFPQNVLPQSKQLITISGAVIIALAHQVRYKDEHQMLEAKKFMRFVIAHHLGPRILNTRKLFTRIQQENKNDIIEADSIRG